MYCPNCKQTFDGKFCPECGTKLIEEPSAGGLSINLGDANAISGDINLHDSHNVQNVDNSVQNISTVNNTTTNVTNISAQKTEMELLQERKNKFAEQVNIFLEDNKLQPEEVAYLENLRIQLGLDELTAKRLIENGRRKVSANMRQTSLGGAAASMLKFITGFFLSNDVAKVRLQLPKLAAFAKQIEVDEVQHKYYVALAALEPQKLINIHESEITDNYWRTFWTYIAYHKLGKAEKAEETLADLYRFSQYSDENITLLQVVEIFNNFGKDEARTILDTVTGMYSQELLLFAQAIYMCVEPEMAEGMGATITNTAFYTQNIISFESPEERAKREEKERAEAERKAKEEAERMAKEEAERMVLIIKEFMEKHDIPDNNYIINPDKSVDVNGNIEIEKEDLIDGKIPFKFGKVTGYFDCSHNQLTSLEGAPEEVGSYFNCRYNNLTSLEGGPKKVDKNYSCRNNELTSLEGGPKEVGGTFNCNCNNLTSLVGAPEKVGGDFFCEDNELTTLEGCPKKVETLNCPRKFSEKEAKQYCKFKNFNDPFAYI